MSVESTIDSEPERRAVAAGSSSRLSISGMTCGNCARHVSEAIQAVPGVHSVMVSVEQGEAVVRWAKGQPADLSAVTKAVQEEGYGAKPASASATETPTRRLAGWELTLWVGALGTVPLFVGEWIFRLGMTAWFQWLSFGLASLVQFFAGAQFYRGAWAQLKNRSSNMDTLVALGSTTAYAYSVWALFSGAGGHVYFMEAASIITLISIGHWMESRVSARASDALKQLMDLAPASARRIDSAGGESVVPVAELVIDDRVVLKPGERVPVDGTVFAGQSAVDESMLTGEAIPVDKGPGAKVFAGTFNANGRLVMTVTATGEETALAQVIAAVQRAQSSRANIQRLGDRISSVFVPVVVAIALAAALLWGLAPETAHSIHGALSHFLWTTHPPHGVAAAFIIGTAVLIIACPCAMGLATPAAIMAGSNAAAKRGILIRDGVALEKAGNVTAVVFDKTGTLTVGKPRFAALWEAKHANGALDVKVMAANLARHSAHPLSLALAELSSVEVPLQNWEEVRGSGLQAELESEDKPVQLQLGSLSWLQKDGPPGEAKAFVDSWSNQGASLVVLNVDGQLAALFAVQDSLKPGAADVVRRLQEGKLRTYLLTGDNRLTAQSIGRAAGIPADQIFAGVRPEEKAALVVRLQGEGQSVAFVGDGINDAPALEQANLGIAVSRASDIAREAADIILLNSEIEAVPESLGLARAALRTIKQNLFWAFFYNAIGIPLAAFGFMSPVLCAAAMGFSDVIVIGNALRLQRRKRSFAIN